MKKTNAIIASQGNVGVLLDRFRKFTKRNEEKSFEIKYLLNNPKEDLVNKKFSKTPKICKFDVGYVKEGFDKCLLSIQPQIIEDVINIHFHGQKTLFEEFCPCGLDLSKNILTTLIIKEGDRVFFKNEGIIIRPKKENYNNGNELYPWMFTTC